MGVRSGPLSPTEERIRVAANRDIIVGMHATVNVGEGAVVEGLAGAGFSQFRGARAAALGPTGRAAVLPEVSQPPKSPGRAGFSQPSAGLIVEPVAGSRTLEVMAWNTREPLRGYNVSHAERQFMEWFSSRGKAWKDRVTSVDVVVYGRDICIDCSSDIQTFINAPDHKHIQFRFVRGDTGRPYRP